MIAFLLAQAVVSTTLTFVTIAQGTQSQIDQSRQAVVRTAAEWQALWKEHSAEPAPSVDFSKSIVAGVFLGSRSSAGYGVEIKAVRRADAGAVIEYVERRPQPGRMRAQVITSPFHLVTIPRDVKTVEFKRIE